MAVTYSLPTISARLQAVADQIDLGGGGSMIVLDGITVLSTIPLSNPCGSVNSGVLTFVPATDPSADGTGDADNAIIRNGNGDTVISDLTVGVPLSGANIIITTVALNNHIDAGQVVRLVAGQIVGS